MPSAKECFPSPSNYTHMASPQALCWPAPCFYHYPFACYCFSFCLVLEEHVHSRSHAMRRAWASLHTESLQIVASIPPKLGTGWFQMPLWLSLPSSSPHQIACDLENQQKVPCKGVWSLACQWIVLFWGVLSSKVDGVYTRSISLFSAIQILDTFSFSLKRLLTSVPKKSSSVMDFFDFTSEGSPFTKRTLEGWLDSR